mmetsp:Transcript_44803/g.87788  ORF Transcript_44803/g.87788 Transcript_44803/m.87788 type:complete len:130 (-) Transcript_44803:225-614(-)
MESPKLIISLRRLLDEVDEVEQLGEDTSVIKVELLLNDDSFVMLNISFTSWAKAAAFQQRDFLGKNSSYLERADIIFIPFRTGSNFGTNRSAEYSTHPSIAFVIITTSPCFDASVNNFSAHLHNSSKMI